MEEPLLEQTLILKVSKRGKHVTYNFGEDVTAEEVYGVVNIIKNQMEQDFLFQEE